MRPFRAIRTGVTAFLYVGMVALMFAPATDGERAALGSDLNRFTLIQKRLATAMVTLAPDMTAQAYAAATGIAPDVMSDHLQARAAGQDMTAGVQINPPDVPAQTTNRRIQAGGALFVTVD